MKSNNDKCHLIVTNNENVNISIGNASIETSNTIELLGIIIDNKLNFNEHISNLLKKGNQKLHALARISKYLDKDKLRIVMKTFIQSQFNYCPLIWMFHSRIMNNKINKLHERALRIVYNNNNLTFQELLDLDNAVTIHKRNLQKLATEIYKVKNNLSPQPTQELLIEHTAIHDLRNKRRWELPNVKTICYGQESVRYRGPKHGKCFPTILKAPKH